MQQLTDSFTPQTQRLLLEYQGYVGIFRNLGIFMNSGICRNHVGIPGIAQQRSVCVSEFRNA